MTRKSDLLLLDDDDFDDDGDTFVCFSDDDGVVFSVNLDSCLLLAKLGGGT